MWNFDTETLREIIEGTITFKPCIKCSGRGYNYTDEDGELYLIKPKDIEVDKYSCDKCGELCYTSDNLDFKIEEH